MLEIFREILALLEQYFVYIYPGFITLFMYHYTKARTTDLGKTTFGISIIISYIYIVLYNSICKKSVSLYISRDYIILLVIAVLTPVLWHWMSRWTWTEKMLLRLGFQTTLENTAWDYIQNRAKQNEGIALKIYFDDQNIMYEGKLRYRESDPKKAHVMCLSGYRRYEKKGEKYYKTKDYSNNHSRWVYLHVKDVSRTEITFSTPK